MNTSVISDLDQQICCAQEYLNLSNSLREKIITLESEKNEALNRCKILEAKINRMKEQKCSNCTILQNKLNQERLERERLKKEEKAKLLETIAKTLEIDFGATNHKSNAQQLLTQLVIDGFDDSRGREKIKLIEDNYSSDEESLKVFADETIITIESEDSSNDFKQKRPVVVPETELQGFCKKDVNKHPSREFGYENNLKENRLSPDEEPEKQHISKKPKCDQVLSLVNEKSNVIKKPYPCSPNVYPEKSSIKNQNEKSPSVLITEAGDETRTGIACGPEEQQSTKWKMKPSFLVEGDVSAPPGGKRLKQMTLSLTRSEKKHDISMSGVFKGGVASNRVLPSDDEKDVILPSPDRQLKKFFSKKYETCETMEDPDQTVFQPNAASTCQPLETSFDKIPEEAKSPPYKYRRDTVRKREKRMKLPGQDCDECAQYYKAAGLDQTQDIKSRMNKCSRHRDKYELRANTPPGFWDPVFPVTPEGSQEES